jgi:hypothetical protein
MSALGKAMGVSVGDRLATSAAAAGAGAGSVTIGGGGAMSAAVANAVVNAAKVEAVEMANTTQATQSAAAPAVSNSANAAVATVGPMTSIERAQQLQNKLFQRESVLKKADVHLRRKMSERLQVNIGVI